MASILLGALYLSAVVAVNPAPAPLSEQQPILRPKPFSPISDNNTNNHAISPGLFTVLEELARVTDIAYCVGPASTISTPFTCASRCSDFPAFELLNTFSASSPLPLLDESATGYLAYDHNPTQPRIVLAFRGTYSIADAVADLGTIPQAYSSYPSDDPNDKRNSTRVNDTSTDCKNCTVHSGFHASYLATRASLLPALSQALQSHPEYRLTISGHSFGGAIATFFALELRARGHELSLTTFGSPRVGNAAFAQHVTDRLQGDVLEHPGNGAGEMLPRMRRVTHVGDPVPGLPWEEWGYVATAGEVYISKVSLPVGFEHVRMCHGSHDVHCSAPPDRRDGEGQEPVDGPADEKKKRGAALAVQRRWEIWKGLKPWEYVTAHRDYFHRLGLCVKTDYGWETGKSHEL